MEGARMFHSGPYEGIEIDKVVDMDPAYILEVAGDKTHLVSQEAVARARRLLDSQDEYDDFDYADDQLRAFGDWSNDDY